MKSSGKAWNDKAAHALLFQKKILGLIGIWPLDAQSAQARRRGFLAVIVELSTLTTLCLEMYRRCDDSRSTMDCMVVLVSSFLSLSKILLHLYNWQHFRELVEAIIEDWSTVKSEAYENIMSTFANRYRLVSLGLFYLFAASATTLLIMALPIGFASALMSTATNVTGRKFPLETYCVYDRTSNFYYFAFGLQIVQISVQTISHSGSDGCYFALTMHLCGQFEILNEDYATLNIEGLSWQKVSGRVVRKHQRLSKLADSLEDAFNMIILVQVLCTVLLLCTAGYQLIYSLALNETFTALKNVFFIMSVLLQLFLFASAADMFQSLSQRLAYSVYECPWYNFGANAMRDLPLIILRANIPHCLTAGKFVVMNILTFQSIMKMSASYMSVLKVMMET